MPVPGRVVPNERRGVWRPNARVQLRADQRRASEGSNPQNARRLQRIVRQQAEVRTGSMGNRVDR